MVSQNINNKREKKSAVHTVSEIMKNVIVSATEVEVGDLFHNSQEVEPIRTTLHDMVHPQPETPTKADNSTASGIEKNTVNPK